MISYIITAAIGLAALWKSINHFLPWLAHDIAMLTFFFKCVSSARKFSKMDPVFTVTDRLIQQGTGNRDKSFIICEKQTFTYKQINDRASQMARVLRRNDLKPDEVVAVMMKNCPAMISASFGILKAGGIVSFINYNLTSNSLVDCIKISECSKIIVSEDGDILKAVCDVEGELTNMGITVYVAGKAPESGTIPYHSLVEMADKESKNEVPDDWRRHIGLFSHLCYVFTSGTTGTPKAAIITYSRAWMAANIFGLVGVTAQDIVYTTLPLYHGSAVLLGLLGTLHTGCTMVLRKKFSASCFWDECRKYNITVVQYIGEIMRYLCNQPVKPDDKHHNVRKAFGNGITANVWRKFHARFGEDISISEFYTSTEGNIGYYNITGILGRVGLSSPMFNSLSGVAFVKYDFVNDVPVRDQNGRCVKVALGTPGLLIGKIGPKTPFLGYRGNSEITEKKILRDVFKIGDKYFDTGDILLRHRDYTVSFIDRVGDTYRWKGENISSHEVSDIMAKAPGVSEANAYGVRIPGTEGRAGMVVIVLRPSCPALDCKALYQHSCTSLPSYARPLFIRIQPKLQLTDTWKQQKTKLVKQGYDLSKTGNDPLYLLDAKRETYVSLTQKILTTINSGTLQL